MHYGGGGSSNGGNGVCVCVCVCVCVYLFVCTCVYADKCLSSLLVCVRVWCVLMVMSICCFASHVFMFLASIEIRML